MINGDYTLGRAKKLAERIGKQQASSAETLQNAIQLAWGRDATQLEMDDALAFVKAANGGEESPLDHERLVDFCHVLLNSNEFLYVD